MERVLGAVFLCFIVWQALVIETYGKFLLLRILYINKLMCNNVYNLIINNIQLLKLLICLMIF